MSQRNEHDEETLARLLGALPAPPRAWVEAAAMWPQTRRDADRIVSLARADQEFQAAVTADLEAALRAAGHEPTHQLLAAVRERLDG